MRRPSARDRRACATPWKWLDPFVALSADNAWRAEDAVDNGSVTTSIPSYVGTSHTLTAQGTGQAIKATSSALKGRYAISSNGVTAAGGYGAATLGAAPSALTLVWVARLTGTGVTCAFSGELVYFAAGDSVSARKASGSNANVTVASPANIVNVVVFTGSNIVNYANSYTGVSVANAAALAGTTFRLMTVDGSNNLVMTGLWAMSGYWLRALSSTEIAQVLSSLGQRYGVTIAP